MVDNHGFVLGPSSVKPVNQHATLMLPETLTQLMACTPHLKIDRQGAALTLDSGVDSKAKKASIRAHR
jgi:hypothetical protein